MEVDEYSVDHESDPGNDDYVININRNANVEDNGINYEHPAKE